MPSGELPTRLLFLPTALHAGVLMVAFMNLLARCNLLLSPHSLKWCYAIFFVFLSSATRFAGLKVS